MSDESGPPAVPEPSYLPPNPSVGELVTEIDRARHEAARTLTALVDKLDVTAMMRRRSGHGATVLGWDGPALLAELRTLRGHVVDATPEPVADAVGTARRYVRRVPMPVRIVAVLVLLRVVRSRRRR